MIEKVSKRDGTIVPFEERRIYQAISYAYADVYGELSEEKEDEVSQITDNVVETLNLFTDTIHVETIQDVVEQEISAFDFYAAKAYITYRYKRAMARNDYNSLMDIVSEKLNAERVENQNANVDERSFGGRIGSMSGAVAKHYALNYCMSKKAKENHLNNIIYTHDLDSYAVGMHNCVGRETRFLTTEGVKSFDDFTDGETINVITHTGEIKEATVKCYGEQTLYDITLKRGGTIKTIRATANHRWLLNNGSITDNLKIGDVLIDAPEIFNFDYYNSSYNEKLMWCKGFTYGDGTLEYSKGVQRNRTRIRLCGDKRKYLDRFDIDGCSINNQTANNEPIVKVFDYNKEIPYFENYNEIKAFVDGLYCADGYQGKNKGIQFTGQKSISFVERYFESCGYYISRKTDKTNKSTNYGKRNDTTIEFGFTIKPSRFKWKVQKIEKSAVEKVYCLDVQDNHSFIISGGIVTGNCLTLPIDDLLSKGFNTRQCDVRPANSVNTAFQLVAVLFQIQSLQQFGGVSAGHLDWSMVPYVRKSFTKHLGDGLQYVEKISEYKTKRFHKWIANDKENHPDGTIHFDDKEFQSQHPEAWEYAMGMTVKETYQAVEGMYHNLNTLQSRSGNQLPFSSINYGTCTLPEGRLVIKALLDTSIKGVGKLHKTSVFPCGIFQMMKGVNRTPDNPNYDLYRLALKSTAKRLYPNYANVDWTGNAGYDPNDPKTFFSTMGCRTANGWDINGFGQLKDGRGNICPVTIILPTLAMMSDGEVGNKNIDSFMSILKVKIAEAREQLIERFEWICSQSPDSARFMYENGTMAGYIPEEGIRSALKHGTLAIGQLGLAETLQILIGKDHTTTDGMELAKRIEGLFKERCAKFKEQDKLNYGVYLTPAENLAYTAMQKFKSQYGEIKNISDREYFTNSIHVPVWYEIDPFEKIDIESQLTGYSSAGCITYVELPETAKNNIDALETIVNYAMDKDIPYFAINVPNDTCDDCGFTDEIGDNCPKCGSSKIKRLRRVTGYLTGDYKTAFNAGKQQETEQRVKHIQ